ncbi:Uncharacterised protein [Mycobacteroides abscessus subsp. abscessus]|nr:Uncharacterised protein [Mycobacteroides abscessus subsp. abscessus]
MCQCGPVGTAFIPYRLEASHGYCEIHGEIPQDRACHPGRGGWLNDPLQVRSAWERASLPRMSSGELVGTESADQRLIVTSPLSRSSPANFWVASVDFSPLTCSSSCGRISSSEGTCASWPDWDAICSC